ncbi:MAG: hypothetical protein VKJ64_20815, partial [Leptolyngbyaceae bacterium]|nr:hypothetical protein [Leptolyngbyaceae bacterium]
TLCYVYEIAIMEDFMSSDRRDLVPFSTAQPELDLHPSQDSGYPDGHINIYRPKPSPLPHNRPIADNNTEAMDEMLGYLD